MIKAIIFDCFGVVRIDAFDLAYQHFGGDIVKDHDFIRQAVYESNGGGVPSYTVIPQHLGVTTEEWKAFTARESTVNQEVLDYAKELRKTYKTAMLSNIGKGRIGDYFEPGFLDDYFDLFVASGDIGYAKPEAAAYEYVADKLGVRLDECVFTDDRQEYIDGATAVGMKTILFTSAKQFKADLSGILGR